MDKTEIDDAFKHFEAKYDLPPIFRIANEKVLGAFIITKDGESFMITFESSEDDIVEVAHILNPDHVEEAAKDILALKAYCSVPTPPIPAPEMLQ